jgi:hypothetical protein
MWLVLALVVGSMMLAWGESDGLARVPAAGWNSWNWVGARTDCGAEPTRCLNEELMREMADALLSTGMADAGFDIVNLSEGWPAPRRGTDGRLMGDPDRFPSGIAALGDYIHKRGLRFGIYLDAGTTTCAGFPGSYGHEVLDVQTIVEWGADYVWLDGCNFPGNLSAFSAAYEQWGALFHAAGRSIVWEASLPAYNTNISLDFVASFSHEFRYYRDIRPDWDVIMDIVDYTVTNDILRYARPGQWPLMDMMEVGNPPLTTAESRAHFGLWAMLAQPLHAGNDIRNMTADIRALLTNMEVIAVARDVLGRPATRIASSSAPARGVTFWTTPPGAVSCEPSVAQRAATAGLHAVPDDCCVPVAPSTPRDGAGAGDVYLRLLADSSLALLAVNRGPGPLTVCAPVGGLGLNPFEAVHVRDLWAHSDAMAHGSVCAVVASHDAAMFVLQQ